MGKIDYEFEWFNKHRNDIITGHYGKMVVIKDHQVQGYFDDYMPAIDCMKSQGIEMGNFIVQPCVSEEEDTLVCHTVLTMVK